MRKSLLAASITLCIAACQQAQAPQASAPPAPAATNAPATQATEAVVDEHSYSQPDKVRTTDLALDLALDFAKKTISGTSTYSLDWLDKSATQLVLDTRDITIQKAEGQGADGQWKELKFALAPA
ncbi:MAG: aminopeptidase, partial [Proteobacteria bacterium]|nr:aminopeptidase [Pseudomonadota bacterium]